MMLSNAIVSRVMASSFVLASSHVLPPQLPGSEVLAVTEAWREVATPIDSKAGRDSESRLFHVSLDRLRESLIGAPLESPGHDGGVEIDLPLPSGAMSRLRVVESPILGPELQRRLPEVHTYVVTGVDDPRVYGRIDLTSLGVRALVFDSQGAFLIDPWVSGRTDIVKSYWARDDLGGSLECKAIDSPARMPASAPRATSSFGAQRRNYRFILMGTGEYTQALGGVEPALAEMVTSMNRVNAVFERDVGAHFEVVGLTPFEDPATDPYPTATLVPPVRNQVVVDSIYGSSSYDVAQVVTQAGAPTSFNGVAAVYGVCDPAYKAYNSVALGTVPGNPRMTHVMTHESGHQLGSWHIGYSACQFGEFTPYEPGSGSTIMGRAGKCGVNDVQPQADLYFNVASIEAMVSHLDTLSGCGTMSPTGNAPPSAEAGPDFTIPRETPFGLTGSGADPDPGDTLTYCWEQQDGASTLNDLVLGALFRSRLPSPSPVRYFPQIATVLADTLDRWEKLPPVDRLLHFRLTVRDGHPGGAGVAWDAMVVTVSGDPFSLSSPNGGEKVPAGSFPVTWTVGGGAVAPNVNVLLSTDGGAAWTLLAANTPNDGAEVVTHHTATTSATCRIRIEAVGSIFYDLSDADFTIAGSTTDVPTGPVLPHGIALGVEGANPAARAELFFDLPREGQVELAVYSAAGRRVRTLVARHYPAGRHHVSWNGDGEAGERVGAGVYFIRLTSGGRRAETRVVLVR